MKEPITLVGRYYNQQGGVSNVMAQLAMRAASQYAVTIASAEFLDGDEQLGQIDVPMIRRPRWAQTPSFAFAARSRVRQSAASIVHAHDPQYVGADLYTAHSCFKRYIRTQRNAGGPLMNTLSHLYPPHVSGVAMANLAYRRAPLIVAVSGSIRSEIIEEHEIASEKVRVIYNGVDVLKFAGAGKAAARAAVQNELSVQFGDKLVLIFVGYEFDRKRLDVVLKAMSDADPGKCHLLVVGGADPSKYESLAAELGVGEHVSFMGHREDVPQLLRASDVFVFPTKYEAASLAILEAAAAGLAIITTNVAMAAEVFSDGKDALLVPNTDEPKAVARRLKDLLHDPTLRNRLGGNAADLAARFSWDNIWRQYDDVYAEVLRLKRGQR